MLDRLIKRVLASIILMAVARRLDDWVRSE